MKKWKDKWADREQKSASPLIVGVAGTGQPKTREETREEGMKKWRDKWTDREQKNASPLIVGVAETEQPKTRNIEMIKGKQVAQSALNVK